MRYSFSPKLSASRLEKRKRSACGRDKGLFLARALRGTLCVFWKRKTTGVFVSLANATQHKTHTALDSTQLNSTLISLILSHHINDDPFLFWSRTRRLSTGRNLIIGKEKRRRVIHSIRKDQSIQTNKSKHPITRHHPPHLPFFDIPLNHLNLDSPSDLSNPFSTLIPIHILEREGDRWINTKPSGKGELKEIINQHHSDKGIGSSTS